MPLVVWWLQFDAFFTVARVQSLVWELRSYIKPLHAMPLPPPKKKKKKEKKKKLNITNKNFFFFFFFFVCVCVFLPFLGPLPWHM